MPFTVHDYRDLVDLLGQHPEWQGELRRLLLTEDLLVLPGIVRELVAAQQRAEGRLERLEVAVAALVEGQRALVAAQQRTEARLERLEEGQQELAKGQQELAKGQQELAKGQQRLWDKVGGMHGRQLEATYREKAGDYLGHLLRRVRVYAPHTLEDELEARLGPEEFREVLRLDLVVSGRPRGRPEAGEVWLAVEVSAVVDAHDVARARRRAGLLRQAGFRAIPVVAGEQLAAEAEAAMGAQPVVVLLDGHVLHWDEALAGEY